MACKAPKVSYRDKLEGSARERYDTKIADIGIDPYEVTSGFSCDFSGLPPITYIDIINYLVNTKSAYTMEQLKAVKSLDSYNQFVNGWVRDVQTMAVNDKILVVGRVRHSQRMNEKALKPWVISSEEGIIQSAHCDCMAGLGEVCSHVGAMLFYVEHVYKLETSKTVTDKKAYWLPPSIDKVKYAEVGDINFSSADVKKKQLDIAVSGQAVQKKSGTKLPNVTEPTAEERRELEQALFHTDTKPSVLSVRKDYQAHYVPEILIKDALPILTDLREDKHSTMDEDELRKECGEIFDKLIVTEDQAKHVEYITKTQAKSKEWHALRTGRITASNMKSVCATKLNNPSKTVVNSICGNSRFTNKATQWGCQHESIAIDAYEARYKEEHNNASVEKCGLFLNPKYPHLGASPDAVVSCSCCGEGVVEVKCPYCIRDSVIDDSMSFMHNGQLKRNHQYFYQVQSQLLVTERDFSDFVTWTKSDLKVERIEPCEEVITEMVEKSKIFFVEVILPELLGNMFTRHLSNQKPEQTGILNQTNVDGNLPCQKPEQTGILTLTNANGNLPCQSDADSEALICVCRKPYDQNGDSVIGCDSENCPYQWLHFKCVGLKKVPKGAYFCPECKPNNVFKKQKKK